ncbi:hypothetical protein QTG54_004172 [Skeletonema marinoi]|uniref:Uncharacterized protein n=1 Tax=Skeletonema marinoi TaxID=267567 RepID=A0AAD9DEP2_9STRA|nr:hypothetical protein QTG54_004172 [Skeletonema marinoi]|mmetsp:Transcript_4021/g.8486  ORF Transcript_4021/g.8486 Transcript_4021/m.8486 type:complete len:89 (+) Transcript_4021:36-302(+)|eukprot:CAMPEP_0113372502 /NCGR_PEP_ID=MMETSP0013_2-20120614/571_1 /TAXON_ID=2843 ORGANISM="Skeletonema costatum, Strain 1716" /NCGR_SAMPLE_ID=MMETSP0013_2 /ASSEMBLY_ACC=CAM_ASM_000158 /LENGTH=88 /DNA_ID=CAMNT_0000254403 /DNA_START=36 /DNA_END=302 /DNA_ORIENTATION=- /assembly_acc=CAM_ASM_000158
MSFIEKAINPAFYKQKISTWSHATAEYYKPLFRSGSVKPLWHIMIATSVLMYTQNYLFNKGTHIQHARQEKKVALEEYYKNHNITPGH